MKDQNKLSRRDFGRSAAIGAGAIAAFNIASSAKAANAPMKIGVIGCGGRGTGAVKNAISANENVQLVAVADAFEDRAQGLIDNVKGGAEENVKVDKDHMFIGLDAYRGLLKMKLDYVILATPPGFRPEHFEAVVEAGLNCFTEKPVAVDPNGTRRFMKAAKKSEQKGLSVVAGTQRRHQKEYVETIARIHDGALGEVVAGRAYWDGGLPFAHDRKPEWSDLEFQMRNWYNFCWICGDNIVEQHVHNLDIMNWVIQAHPVSVIASGGRCWKPLDDPKYGNIWDHFSCDYEYPNGVHVMSFSRHLRDCYNEVSERIFGTNKAFNNGISNCVDMASDHVGGHAYVQEHIDLQDSITGEGPKLNEAMQVAESVFTAIMGRMAAYTGMKLSWDDALNTDLDTMPKNLSFDGKIPVAPIPVPGA